MSALPKPEQDTRDRLNSVCAGIQADALSRGKKSMRSQIMAILIDAGEHKIVSLLHEKLGASR